MQVEAMKTRDSARKMVEYMRQVNPGLAKALTDDRDEVWHTLKDMLTRCSVMAASSLGTSAIVLGL